MSGASGHVRVSTRLGVVRAARTQIVASGKYRLSLCYMWLLRLSGRRAGVVLMYHGVEPRRGDPRSELSPPLHRDAFTRHLRHLVKHYRVVAASEIQAAAENRRRGNRFPIALTFDDDSRSHFEIAVPLMQQAGVSATFFLNGLALEEPRSYWWERMQRAKDGGEPWSEVLPVAVFEAAHAASGGDPQGLHVSFAVQAMSVDDRRTWSDALRERLGGDPDDAGLRAHEVRRMRDQGFDIGFHGANHEPLALLDEPSIARELEDGRTRLEEAAGAVVDTIAYPHGSVDGRVADAARAHGYRVGFTVREEAVRSGSDALQLGRLDAQIDSISMFGRRLVRVLRTS